MRIIRTSKSYVAYHGTKDKSLSLFDISFSGKGHDQEGPGVYFTSSEDDARGYGSQGKVLKVRLNLNKVVPLKGKANSEEVKKLILWSLGITSEEELENVSDEKFYESNLSNFGEDIYSGFRDCLNSVIKYSKSPHDCFMTVWYELYRNVPTDYLKNMVKLGYDGVIVPKVGCYHYVVFNTNAIEIL